MNARKVDDGWDDYCVTAAKAHLLTVASKMLTEAGTKHVAPERVVLLRSQVARCIDRLSDAGRAPDKATGAWTEREFRNFLAMCFGFGSDVADKIVDPIKFEAKTLRGQLDLFEKESASCDK